MPHSRSSFSHSGCETAKVPSTCLSMAPIAARIRPSLAEENCSSGNQSTTSKNVRTPGIRSTPNNSFASRTCVIPKSRTRPRRVCRLRSRHNADARSTPTSLCARIGCHTGTSMIDVPSDALDCERDRSAALRATPACFTRLVKADLPSTCSAWRDFKRNTSNLEVSRRANSISRTAMSSA